MEELKQLVHRSRESLPDSPKGFRQMLDFIVVPNMVYRNGAAFIRNCLQWKEAFLCDLFNTYYENEDGTKPFRPDDFSVRHQQAEGKLLVITLPQEDVDALEFCRSYVIAYTQTGEVPEAIQFFAIADSLFGWNGIYRIHENGSRTRITAADRQPDENLAIIQRTAFPQ